MLVVEEQAPIYFLVLMFFNNFGFGYCILQLLIILSYVENRTIYFKVPLNNINTTIVCSLGLGFSIV